VSDYFKRYGAELVEKYRDARERQDVGGTLGWGVAIKWEKVFQETYVREQYRFDFDTALEGIR
jgi:hypothetical protein